MAMRLGRTQRGDGESREKNVSRRNFLKFLLMSMASISGIGGVQTLLMSRTADAQPHAQETEPLRFWLETEILADPVAFLSYTIRVLQQTNASVLSHEALSMQKAYIRFWTEMGGARLNVVRKALKVQNDLGQSLGELLHNVNAHSHVFVQLGIWDQAMYQHLTTPLTNLAFCFAPASDPSERITSWYFDQLKTWYNHIEPLVHSYAETAYDQRGRAWINEHHSELDERIDNIWDTLQKSHQAVPEELLTEPFSYRTPEERLLFATTKRVIEEHFPFAFIGISYADLGTNDRAFYNNGLMKNNRRYGVGVHMGDVVHNAVAQAREGGGGGLIEFNLLAWVHEIFHHYDIDYRPQYWRHWSPLDVLGYVYEQQTTMLAFRDGFRNINLDDVAYWLIDPQTPKIFGVDDLHSDMGLRFFHNEISLIRSTFDLLVSAAANFPNVRGYLGGFLPLLEGKSPNERLLWWALETSEELKNDPDLFATHFGHRVLPTPDYNVPEFTNEQFRKVWHKVDGKHLDVLLNIAESYSQRRQAGEEPDREIMLTLLRAKSYYLLCAYAMLNALWDAHQQGNLGLTDEVANMLFTPYQTLSTTILAHIRHCMVGPYGQYLPFANTPYREEIALPLAAVMSAASQDATLARQSLRRLLGRYGYYYDPDSWVAPQAERLLVNLASLVQRRLRLLGVRPQRDESPSTQAQEVLAHIPQLYEDYADRLERIFAWKTINHREDVRASFQKDYPDIQVE